MTGVWTPVMSGEDSYGDGSRLRYTQSLSPCASGRDSSFFSVLFSI
jgi:hypothetical protein